MQIIFFLVLQLSGFIALSIRGDCDFMTKAEFAESGGAAGLVVINDGEGCSIWCTIFQTLLAFPNLKF